MASDALTLEELEPLLDRLGDELFAYLCALTRDRERAQDLLQQVFMKFIEQVEQGRILRNTAEHYLKRMCKNAFIDLTRREKRIVALPEQELAASEDQEKIRTISSEVRIVLTEALADEGLEAEVAQVLRMRLLLELDVRTICERTDRSRSTVQRQMRKGMTFLADAFRRANLTLAELDA